jgi:hypothetical protein
MTKLFKIIINLLGRHLVLFPTGIKPVAHAHWGLSRGLVSQNEFVRLWQSLSCVQSPPMTVK